MKIQLQKLKKSFGEKVAVSIPHLQIDNGEIIGLVGNNGAGKTTLFKLILDLLQADSGHVVLVPQMDKCAISSTVSFSNSDGVGIDPSKSEEWKKMTGAFIDETFLIDFLTVEEYLDFIIKVQGLPAIDWDNNHDQLIRGFEEFAEGQIFHQKKLIRDFSAGNKQKVGIMAAMISRPEFLILDEPFNFLDPTGQNFLKKLLLDYHQQTDATILISSHNLQHLVDVSSRIVLLEDGKVLEDLSNDNQRALDALNDYFKV